MNYSIIPKVKFNPPIYNAIKTTIAYNKDGNNDKFWEQAEYSDSFGDITTGDIPNNKKTHFKMLWDKENIYIKAIMHGEYLYATKTKHDDIIYHDNNFEVFFDFLMTTECYYEFEINALNTIWDLILTKPYRDGGRAISSFETKGIFTKTKVNGTLNKLTNNNKSWECELIFPIESLKELAPFNQFKSGTYIRANFSRTDWELEEVNDTLQKKRNLDGSLLPENNYTWATTGLVNIHYPEMWGFIYLAENKKDKFKLPQKELDKFELRKLYYMQHIIKNRTNKFTNNLNELQQELKEYPNLLPLKNLNYEISVFNNDFIIKTNQYIIYTDGIIKTL